MTIVQLVACVLSLLPLQRAQPKRIRLRSTHSIHSYWKFKQKGICCKSMLATYVPHTRNSNLEIRVIAGSTSRPQ